MRAGFERHSPTANIGSGVAAQRASQVHHLMASLFFICPTTHLEVPTGIGTDVQSLHAAWKAMLKVKCPHCGKVHEISVRETYINGALQDVGRLLGADKAH
jgi:hypothetical protein